MCGICGIFNYKDHSVANDKIIRRMAKQIAHRGPDDEGFYYDKNLGLGFRRLSIIDLNNGTQPMSDAAKSIWLVFNGEIYNYPELRDELRGLGHEFKNKSDTEVIIYGYKQWGIDVLNHLNGMFGFALWDVQKRRLLLARDAMGIKPVYYTIKNGSLAFCSEIAPLFTARGEKREIDPYPVSLFLRFRYTPSPLTIYKDIQKLASGTCLIAEEGAEPIVKRWYTYAPEPFNPMPSPNEAGEMLLDAYKKALKRHLLSDVPIGLLLSGGVDSALLLGLMKEHGDLWNTYTVGYGEGSKDDELEDAKITADIFGTPNVSVRLTLKEFEKNIAETICTVEEPVATSSIVPMYYVSQRARQDVKVVLMGQGPDELFGGYTRHLGLGYGEYWRFLPAPVRKLLMSFSVLFPRNETLKRSIYSLNIEQRLQRYQNVFSIISGDQINSLFRKDILPFDYDFKVGQLWNDLLPYIKNTGELGGFQMIELRSSLPDELLIYGDKLSMRHGLEVRVPFLDKEIVEFVQRLPDNYKVRNGVGKWLHKKISRKYLPPKIINRRKRGFAYTVVDDWFRNTMSSRFGEIFDNVKSPIYTYLNNETVQHLYREHKAGKANNYKILFSIIVLEYIMEANG